jgi:hypothetical protein
MKHADVQIGRHNFAISLFVHSTESVSSLTTESVMWNWSANHLTVTLSLMIEQFSNEILVHTDCTRVITKYFGRSSEDHVLRMSKTV